VVGCGGVFVEVQLMPQEGAVPIESVEGDGQDLSQVFDAIIISDLHLGSDNCQAKSLCAFLESIVEGERRTAKLILNGDVFDSIDFRRLKKNHWKVLSLIRKLSDKIEIIWICGNHDGSAEIISHLLGVQVADEFVLASSRRHILVLHGHVFDEFLDAHPVLTWLGDLIYWFLQSIDRTHYFAKLAKRNSKTFLRCSQIIEDKSRRYARGKQCSAVCCGHTHHAVANWTENVHYFNSGCWTELPSTYLTIVDGNIEAFHPPEVQQEEDELTATPPPEGQMLAI
jgi:UDP-2,3-diacylglucosamine pyrophosphatase LpxH